MGEVGSRARVQKEGRIRKRRIRKRQIQARQLIPGSRPCVGVGISGRDRGGSLDSRALCWG